MYISKKLLPKAYHLDFHSWIPVPGVPVCFFRSEAATVSGEAAIRITIVALLRKKNPSGTQGRIPVIVSIIGVRYQMMYQH